MNQLATSGIENIYTQFSLSDGSLISCNFFDAGGSIRFRNTNESFYKKVDGCILVFDLTNQASFDDIKNYFIPKIKELCKLNIPVLLLGNKKDLEDLREISFDEAYDLAIENNYIYKEVSCLENYKLKEIFEDIIEKTKDNLGSINHYANNDTIVLQINDNNDNNLSNRSHSCRRCC